MINNFTSRVLGRITIQLNSAGHFRHRAIFARHHFRILRHFARTTIFQRRMITREANGNAKSPTVRQDFSRAVRFTAIEYKTRAAHSSTRVRRRQIMVNGKIRLFGLRTFRHLRLIFRLIGQRRTHLTFIRNFNRRLYQLRQRQRSLGNG